MLTVNISKKIFQIKFFQNEEELFTMEKRLKGFTLVELIVVIAIIGVLAAILVPSMLGYIKRANQTSANQNARTIFNQLAMSAIDLDEAGIVMGNQGNFTLSDSGVTGDLGDCVDLKAWLSSGNFSSSQESLMSHELGGYIDIIYKGGYPYAVAWSKGKDSDAIIGRYPEGLSLNSGADWSNWDSNL